MAPVKVTMFDGGMGHLLKQKKLKLDCLDGQHFDKYFLVGAYANVEQPKVVEDLHLEFIQAGAEVITTNNFAATPWALRTIGKEHNFEQLLEVTADFLTELVYSRIGCLHADMSAACTPLHRVHMTQRQSCTLHRPLET